jgi:hypothetical protein
MPVGWAAAGAAVAGLGAAAMQSDAAGDAAEIQGDAARYAADVNREMFDISRTQQLPFMASGYGANDVLSRLMGLAPTAGKNVDPTTANLPANGWQSRWDENNGRLIGNEYLPPDVELVDKGKGWYEVHHGGGRVGTLRPGGRNGIFDNDTGWKMPQPNATQYAGDGSTTSLTGAPIGEDGYAADNTGLATGFLTQLFTPEAFKAGMDPGYAWRLQQGAQGVMNTAAAGSGSLSGPALKALMDYNQGSASQEYGAAFNRFQTQQGNIFQRLTSMASMGQNAAAGVGNQAVATGGNIGANITGGANAAAAGQIGAANAWGGALSDLGAYGAWYAQNRAGGKVAGGP